MNQPLLQLLNRQRDTSAELLAVLEQESQAVLNGDLQTLQRIGQDKQACCQAITNMEDNWPASLRQDDARLWVKQQGEEISLVWDSLMEQLRQCRRQNDANGLLIAERQQWVAQRLSPVSTQTYGSAGQSAATPASNWVASA